jgi:hypothetical protein
MRAFTGRDAGGTVPPRSSYCFVRIKV